jgi:hypothetical protein
MKLSQIRNIKDPTIRYKACKQHATEIRAELAELTAIRAGAVAQLYESGLSWKQVANKIGLASGGYASNLAAGRGVSNRYQVGATSKAGRPRKAVPRTVKGR